MRFLSISHSSQLTVGFRLVEVSISASQPSGIQITGPEGMRDEQGRRTCTLMSTLVARFKVPATYKGRLTVNIAGSPIQSVDLGVLVSEEPHPVFIHIERPVDQFVMKDGCKPLYESGDLSLEAPDPMIDEALYVSSLEQAAEDRTGRVMTHALAPVTGEYSLGDLTTRSCG